MHTQEKVLDMESACNVVFASGIPSAPSHCLHHLSICVGQELGQKLRRPKNTVSHTLGQYIAAQCVQRAVPRALPDLNVSVYHCPEIATEH